MEPSRTGRRAGRNREDILARAGEVLVERGVEGLRFSDVAERAATSISTLQYLFGTRDDLVAQTLRGRSIRLLREARERAAAVADPLDRLRWVAGHLANYHSDPDSARADWILWVEYWRAALRDDDLGAESVASYEGWLELIRDAIRHAVAAGVVDPPADLDEVAHGACAIADGLGIQLALRHPGMTPARAAAITRSWLAAALRCPALQLPPDAAAAC